jgi:hypothetical protein
MQKNKLSKLTSKTPIFLREKPSNAKGKTTGPSPVKSSTINNNEFTISSLETYPEVSPHQEYMHSWINT